MALGLLCETPAPAERQEMALQYTAYLLRQVHSTAHAVYHNSNTTTVHTQQQD